MHVLEKFVFKLFIEKNADLHLKMIKTHYSSLLVSQKSR